MRMWKTDCARRSVIAIMVGSLDAERVDVTGQSVVNDIRETQCPPTS